MKSTPVLNTVNYSSQENATVEETATAQSYRALWLPSTSANSTERLRLCYDACAPNARNAHSRVRPRAFAAYGGLARSKMDALPLTGNITRHSQRRALWLRFTSPGALGERVAN